MHHPPAPRRRVSQQAHLAEVELALRARLAVGYPHRHIAAPAAPVLQYLQRVPVQRPLRYHDTAAGQQFPGLDHRQALSSSARLFRMTSFQQSHAWP